MMVSNELYTCPQIRKRINSGKQKEENKKEQKLMKYKT